MKKSSLGRRSSVGYFNNQSSLDKTKNRAEGKKSLLLKPGFATTNSASRQSGARCSSADRQLSFSTIKKEPPSSGIIRSKSQLNFDFGRTSTPCQTPVFQSTASGRRESGRSSSVGGVPGRKETRPITEKSFLIPAQQKIEEFFLNHSTGTCILDNGSMKPMNATMFVDMIDFLVKILDPRVCITKANYMEEIPRLTKVYMYRGKIDRSWLISVNTAHSWPHVVALLLWLVELCQQAEVLRVYDVMYPTEFVDDEEDDEDDINDINFRILIPHLLNGYCNERNNGDDDDDMNQFVLEHKMALGVTDDEMIQLEETIRKLQEEMDNIEDRTKEQDLENIKVQLDTVNSDIKQCEEFIENAQEYAAGLAQSYIQRSEELKETGMHNEMLKEKLNELHLLVGNQEMSLVEKQKIEAEIVTLQQEILYFEESSKQYKDMLYPEDINIVTLRTNLNKHLLEYNKEITAFSPVLPQLKEFSIDVNVLHKDAVDILKYVDDKLGEMKTEIESNKVNKKNEMQAAQKYYEEEKLKLKTVCEEIKSMENETKEIDNKISEVKNKYNEIEENLKQNLLEVKTKISAVCDAKIDLTEMNCQIEQLEQRYLADKQQVERYVAETVDIMKKQRTSYDNVRAKIQDIRAQLVEETKIMTKILEEMKEEF